MRKIKLRRYGKSPRAKLIKELDILWSRKIRTRDKWICQRCGKGGKISKGIHGAHIFSRNNYSTRWDLDNGITLCMPCHYFWFHRSPMEATIWIQEIWAEEKLGIRKFNQLKKKARGLSHYSLKDLEGIRKDLENG